MTDADLEHAERCAALCGPDLAPPARVIRELVAEVRRLRAERGQEFGAAKDLAAIRRLILPHPDATAGDDAGCGCDTVRTVDAVAAVADAAVSGLGLKKDHATPTDVKEVIAGLQAEAELYRRGYGYIRAADISSYLSMCEVAGQIGEQALLVAEQLFDLGASEGMRCQKEEAQHGQA